MSKDAKKIFSGLKGPGLWASLRELMHPREIECLQVEVTSCCPGKCTYCPHTTRADVWKSRHMQPETFAALFPIMKKNGGRKRPAEPSEIGTVCLFLCSDDSSFVNGEKMIVTDARICD